MKGFTHVAIAEESENVKVFVFVHDGVIGQ